MADVDEHDCDTKELGKDLCRTCTLRIRTSTVEMIPVINNTLYKLRNSPRRRGEPRQRQPEILRGSLLIILLLLESSHRLYVSKIYSVLQAVQYVDCVDESTVQYVDCFDESPCTLHFPSMIC